MGEVLYMPPRDVTLNVDSGDGFTCLICGHAVPYTNETEWADFIRRDGRDVYMHGTEGFQHCPHCGRTVIELGAWIGRFPQDANMTFGQLSRKYRMGM